MRAFLDRQITRFWIKLATLGVSRNPNPTYRFQPGDEERLLQALVGMNAALARVARF